MQEVDLQTKNGERKAILIKIDDDLLKSIKHVAVDLDRSLISLVDEALRFWLIEYRENSDSHKWGADE